MIAVFAVLASPAPGVSGRHRNRDIAGHKPQHISGFSFPGLASRPKMGYAGACVEDENETSVVGVGHHRQTGLHP
jgi:hypothetical protein